MTTQEDKKIEKAPFICDGNHFDWEAYEAWLKKSKRQEPQILRERK